MKSHNMESKKNLAIGSVLCTFGAAAIFFLIISKLSLLSNSLAYAIVFLLGVVVGIGSVLVLFYLRKLPAK
ncbi:MAG: hypothetical protein ACE5IW_07665 [bacterium]